MAMVFSEEDHLRGMRACRSRMSVAFPMSWSNDRLGRRCKGIKRASKKISAVCCPVFREAYLLAGTYMASYSNPK